MRKAYQTDLTDAEWSCLESYIPAPKPNGRPRIYPLREILDAIFYVLKSGCAWRLLPHDFPPWKTVYHFFRFWRLDGTWERMHAALRQRVRVRLKRNPQPSAAIVDSQGRSRPRAWAEKSAVTTEPRRSKDANATCW
jgi:putative transposase